MEGLLEDLLEDLRAAGVLFEPWGDVAGFVRDNVLAVAYAPSDDVPTQAFLRPVEVELAIVVARDIQKRLAAYAQGEDVFQSYDPVHNRRVALIYDLGKV